MMPPPEKAVSKSRREHQQKADTYRTPNAHLYEQYDLLPWCQGAKIHGRQPAHGHGANTVEERVDIRNLVSAIAEVEDDGEEKRSKGAGRCSQCTAPQPGPKSSQDDKVQTVEV
jgi:hypothetical protein